jgi:hypothetical protein
MKRNEELHNSPNIIRMTVSRRMGWTEHEERTGNGKFLQHFGWKT